MPLLNAPHIQVEASKGNNSPFPWTLKSHLKSTNKWKRNNNPFRWEASAVIGKCSHSRTPLAGRGFFSVKATFTACSEEEKSWKTWERRMMKKIAAEFECFWCLAGTFRDCKINHSSNYLSRKQRLSLLPKRASGPKAHTHSLSLLQTHLWRSHCSSRNKLQPTTMLPNVNSQAFTSR